MTVQYQVAADMAIILQYGGANQSVVAGLNNLGLPGLERGTIQVTEFRNDFDRKFAGGANTTVIPYSGNYVTGDTLGQEQLKTYCKNRTKFTDCRLYLNYITNDLDSDFVTCDLANDSVSGFQVTKHLPGSADVNGVIPFSGEMVLNGQYAEFTIHYTNTTIALVDSDPDTLTDSANGFVTAGFVAGQTIIIEGSVADDGQYIIASVAAGTITLTTAAELTGEAAGSSITLHGGS